VGERDCSIQRRHQKLVEEAPAPGLGREARADLLAMGVRIGQAAGLTNAATAEFLLARDGSWSFLEVNTRLQVEHGVTELCTGLDLVAEQFRLAAGRPFSDAVLAAAARAADPSRHAIEVRIAAEDPAADFIPNPGVVRDWVMPAGPSVRVDAGIEAGDRIPPEYDDLMAKILVVADDRPAAIARLRRALDETLVSGVQTTLPFHRFVARHAGFQAGDLSTDWVAETWDGVGERTRAMPAALAALAQAAAADRPTAPTPEHAPSTGTDASAWLGAARHEAVDRWPR
jgi:acetyl/propionyl-CoA carboxylase alpha subunit